MANRNIQMKKKNDTGGWDNLYPVTLSTNVFNPNGNNLNDDFRDLTYEVKQMMRKVTVDDLPTEKIMSAHRGGGRYDRGPIGADNGFSGFDNAIRLGAHIIDVDARRTGDGTFIAMHDKTVDRTSNGRGNVSDFVSSALPSLDTKSVMGRGWENEPIPTVEEILQKYGGRVIITIE